MKIRLAEKSEAEAISRFVSELAVTHIGSTLQVGGLENLLRSMDVDSTITRMTDGFPHWVALEGDAIVGIAVVKPPLAHLSLVRAFRPTAERNRTTAHERGAIVYFQ
jgi:hypothetical protein